jgi:hypothetical protein
MLALAGLGGCSDYSYTQKTTKDVFQQRRRNTVDVLMVVDNSCSMAEEQDKLAANFASFIEAFDNIDVDWQIGVVTTDMGSEEHQGRLVGGDDEIELQDADGRALDRISWDDSWSITEGVAMQLSADATSTTDNDVVTNWCAATSALSGGDLGTPGAANGSCGAAGPPPPPPDSGSPDSGSPDSGSPDTGGSDDGGDSGGDDGSGDDGSGDDGGSSGGSVSVGDIVITEFLPDPGAVADALGEWVELTSMSSSDIDLSGFALVDAGRNRFVFPEGTTLPAGGVFVVGRSSDTAANGGVDVDVVADEGMSLNNNVRVLSSSTPGAEDIFSEMVAVGTSGSGIEMGLDAARAALQPDMLSGHNAGFLRDSANLSLIFVSDENDYSSDGTNDYWDFFAALKGEEAYRDHGILNFSAVAGTQVPAYDGQPSCESSNGVASYGARYVDLASRTDGAIESICDEDFSPIASELGLLVSGLDVAFVLTEPCNVDTLQVTLYADETDESYVGQLHLGPDYSFDIERNAIVFSAEQVPPSEYYIIAEYQVLAGTAEQTVTEESP